MIDTDSTAGIKFTPYQEEFRTRLVTEVQPGSVHVLLAPPGAGKSFAIAGTISELARVRCFQRILVLSPAALTEQWSHTLCRWDLDVARIDGQILRLLQQEMGDSPDKWPAGVCVISADLAKRPEVRSVLSEAHWDLVVFDEAHSLGGQRLQLLNELAKQEPAPAILMATRFLNNGIQSFSSSARIVDWSQAFDKFRKQQGDAGPPLIRVTRKYRRSADEVAIAREVVEIARELGSLTGMTLLRQASSSTSSLEQSVIRWAQAPTGLPDHRDKLENLLLGLDQLHTDSRLDCFSNLVRELANDRILHIVAICEYRATLDYLAAASDDFGFSHFELHGGLANDERRNVVSDFESSGGLLITTGPASGGVSLNRAEAVIHYDLPTSLVAFAKREGRYLRYGRSQPCTVYYLEDETGALPLEGLLLHMIAKLDTITEDPDIDSEGLFRAVMANNSARST